MNELNDFLGIEWGTKFEEFDKPENLIIFVESPQYKHLKVECKVDVRRKIGDFKIDSILYYFFDNRFYGVEIITREWSNSQPFLNYLLSSHGDEYEYYEFEEGINYTWERENVEVKARYSKKTNDMMVTYFFNSIFEESFKYEEESLKHERITNTISKEQKIKEQRKTLPKEDKKCFIATVVYGSDSPEIAKLRQWREDCLVKYEIGRLFVKYYYRIGPVVAYHISKSKISQKLVKTILDTLIKTIFKRKL